MATKRPLEEPVTWDDRLIENMLLPIEIWRLILFHEEDGNPEYDNIHSNTPLVEYVYHLSVKDHVNFIQTCTSVYHAIGGLVNVVRHCVVELHSFPDLIYGKTHDAVHPLFRALVRPMQLHSLVDLRFLDDGVSVDDVYQALEAGSGSRTYFGKDNLREFLMSDEKLDDHNDQHIDMMGMSIAGGWALGEVATVFRKYTRSTYRHSIHDPSSWIKDTDIDVFYYQRNPDLLEIAEPLYHTPDMIAHILRNVARCVDEDKSIDARCIIGEEKDEVKCGSMTIEFIGRTFDIEAKDSNTHWTNGSSFIENILPSFDASSNQVAYLPYFPDKESRWVISPICLWSILTNVSIGSHMVVGLSPTLEQDVQSMELKRLRRAEEKGFTVPSFPLVPYYTLNKGSNRSYLFGSEPNYPFKKRVFPRYGNVKHTPRDTGYFEGLTFATFFPTRDRSCSIEYQIIPFVMNCPTELRYGTGFRNPHGILYSMYRSGLHISDLRRRYRQYRHIY